MSFGPQLFPTRVVSPARARAWALMGWIVLPVGMFFALTAYTVTSSRAQYERRAEQLGVTLADALEQGIAARIDRIDLSLEAIARHMAHRRARPPATSSDIEEHVGFYTETRGEIGVLTVDDAQGSVVVGRPSGAVGIHAHAAAEWFVAQRDDPRTGLYISSPVRSTTGDGWAIVLSRRYEGPGGGFAGTVSAEVPLGYFQKQIEAVNVGSDGFVTLRNARFELLARWTRASPAPDVVGSTRVSPTYRSLMASGRAQASFRSTSPLDDLERTNAMRRVGDLPLVVVIGLSPRDYLADWHHEARAVVGLSVVIAVLYLGGALFVWRIQRQNRESRQRIELMAKVFGYSGESIVVTGPDHRILEVNPAFLRATGYRADEVIGQPDTMIHATRMNRIETDAMRQSVAETGAWRGEWWHRDKGGSDYPTWLSISTLRDLEGEITHHISSSTDVAELKAAEERVLHLAHHDTLTQLPNRVLLHRQLEQAIVDAGQRGSELSTLFIDMDRFKNINDTLGHPVGDGLLIEVAQRLRGLVRERDIVARLGGDEFVVVLSDLVDGARAAATVAAKIIAELGRPYLVRGHELHSTPSIGIGLFPADGRDADTLLKNADTAMYHAKAVGRNNHQYFTAAMNEATLERLKLEAGLRGIVERTELFIDYQPQIDIATMRVRGLEALLRWRHPELGLVPPLKFIPVAEDTGQIEAIGRWVLDEALRQVAVWRASGHGELRVAVNLSAQQLRGEAIVGQVSRALAKHGLPGDALELEITESVAMQDPALTAKLLAELRGLGVAIAIDDFGTGYSSLAYLKQLPLSCLKLDRSFVTDLEHDANDAAICTATIQLAHSLGLGVVAEGVETQAQLQFLRRLGCDMAQGYLISRPMAAAACEAYLGRRSGVEADAAVQAA